MSVIASAPPAALATRSLVARHRLATSPLNARARWLCWAAVIALLLGNGAGLYVELSRTAPVTLSTAVERFRRQAVTPQAVPVAGAVSAPVATGTPAAAAPNVASPVGGTAARDLPASGTGGVKTSPGAGGQAKTGAVAVAAPGPVGTGSAAASRGATPEAGVYSYATSGAEQLALGNANHTYPSSSTITVTNTDCGVNVRWDGLQQRYDQWDTCEPDKTIALKSFVTYHNFYGQVTQKQYTCQPGADFRPATDQAGTTFAGTCSSSDGSQAALKGTVVGTENVTVGGQAVAGLHVRLDETLTGSTKGTRTSDSWYALNNGLLLERTSRTEADTQTPAGYTHYSEQLSLRLSSLAPAR